MRYSKILEEGLDETNHVSRITEFDGARVFDLYNSSLEFDNHFIPNIKSCNKVYNIIKPSGIVIFENDYSHEEEILAWENFEDYAIKLRFILENGCMDFKYGYITGRNSPFPAKGLLSANNSEGYQLWIQTLNNVNESKD